MYNVAVAFSSHLEHEFAAVFERGAYTGERGGLGFLVDPMQYGVGEYRGVRLPDAERGYVAFEKLYLRICRSGVGKLRGGRVHSLGVPAERPEICGKLSSAAAEIEHARPLGDRQKTDESLAVFAYESALFRIFGSIPVYIHLSLPEKNGAMRAARHFPE